MNPELKAKWVAALRSGNFRQCTSVLRAPDNRCCCLGVLCDIVEPEKWDNDGSSGGYWHANASTTFPSNRFLRKVRLSATNANILANINDVSSNFSEAADWIEENL